MRRAILFLVVLAACATVRTASLGEPFSIRVGESVRVGDMVVKLNRVQSDSRCPADVTCIRAGDAAIELSLTRPGASATMTLGIGESAEKPRVTILGHEIEFLELRPYPVSTEKIESSDYVARLRVGR